ncbi:MAG TPA: FHA domain-containing protein [Dictyoglomaceae bacterium]|nr:FHA domain-containing protein [Dictyoglomaceae bacterium]HOL39569.1 FHA domain-containing protein [Dictyoglomaceae bacterium]HOP94974.1 FHA domain-containing protein [Dictyoglomaceae bacterium]HPP16479.1 FHA domain-containing protein [Dictyoglomaceae bacterium]HPU44163.1 FHA domain-containing protein [Dictyoglomaceae bacterium]
MSTLISILLALFIILLCVDIYLRTAKKEKKDVLKMERFESIQNPSNTIKLEAEITPLNWAYLIVRHGGERGKDFKIIKNETTIGREPENDITLIHPTVSRFHAKIIQNDGKYFIEDINSANGTLVNGIKVARELLHDGDIIQVGDVVLVFKCL